MLQVMESLIPEYVVSGYVRERSGSKPPNIAPSNVYRCSDGESLIGANQDTVFPRLRAAMGQPELADDVRYATHVARGKHQDELNSLVENWTRTLTLVEVKQAMLDHGISSGAIYRAPEMLEDRHLAACEALVRVDHPRWGEIVMQNVFPKLSRTPGTVRSLAPQRVGEHNAQIYRERLGLDDAALTDLAARNVI